MTHRFAHRGDRLSAMQMRLRHRICGASSRHRIRRTRDKTSGRPSCRGNAGCTGRSIVCARRCNRRRYNDRKQVVPGHAPPASSPARSAARASRAHVTRITTRRYLSARPRGETAGGYLRSAIFRSKHVREETIQETASDVTRD